MTKHAGAPHDHYTPHGYLDNPFHTRNLNPSGVIRSSPGIGFGWHYPALARGYGYREHYRAALNLAVTVDGVTHYLHEHFDGLHADVHSKNEFRYRWTHAALELTATYWRVGEHALACRVAIAAGEDAPPVRLTAFCSYTRHIGAAGVWGESGLVSRLEGDDLIVQGFEDGAALALAGDRPFAAHGAAAELTTEFLADPSMRGDHVVVTGSKGESVTLHGAVAYDVHPASDGRWTIELVMARGIRRDLAVAERVSAADAAQAALDAARAEDERFWAGAPTLAGDWPDHWRRGFVTDFETVRMMIKQPIGIYRHPWDAMQVHAPRVVLAEAAIDALLLGYADPATAKAMLLGTFADAPAANVPCSREDGSYNMVGANGSECGTAPEWGYPAEVVAHLYRLAPDREWLAAIYPGLAAFLEWWLEHRVDDDGYLVYDNSWESGQDLSARFGPQKEGGGSTIRMVRPVDLQAAMAASCRRMAEFAAVLERSDDETRWSGRAAEFKARVEGLWHDGAYRDYDARVGWSDVWDVMQLAPLALGLAPAERLEPLRDTVTSLSDDAYLWPMFVWTAVDAAVGAGEHEVAATIAHDTVDRAYGYWDSREFSEEGRLPGVTCEYWGLDGRCGAEGYGWGAFGIHLVIGTLVGFRPGGGSFSLTPNLPRAWLVPGRRYVVRNLRSGAAFIDVEYLVTDAGLEVRLEARGGRLSMVGQSGTSLVFGTSVGATRTITVQADVARDAAADAREGA